MSTATLDPTVFDEAADLLETKGWTRGAYCRNGRHCAAGAIAAVLGSRSGQKAFYLDEDTSGGVAVAGPIWTAAHGYVKHFAAQIGSPSWGVPEWNDDPKRKRTQVVRAMRKTAEGLRDD